MIVAGLALAAVLIWPCQGGSADPTVSLQEAKSGCSKYPSLEVKRVLHSNLGNQGPDAGAEGVFYHVEDPDKHDDFVMVVNALRDSDFEVANASAVGLWGKYQAVNMRPGGTIHARISFQDYFNKEPVTVPALDVSFFDLDKEAPGLGIESVRIREGIAEILQENHAFIQTVRYGDDIAFRGVRVGSGEDNPSDPEKPSLSDLRKAVSLSFKKVKSFDVTLSTTAGNFPRFFLFIAKASMLCRKVREPASDVKEVESHNIGKEEFRHGGKKTSKGSFLAGSSMETLHSPDDEPEVVNLSDDGTAGSSFPSLVPLVSMAGLALVAGLVFGFFALGARSGRALTREMQVVEYETVTLQLVDVEEERRKAEAEEERLAKLPKLICVFESPDGKTRKTVTFWKKWPGVLTCLELPMVVQDVKDAEAVKAGIAKGWILCEVGSGPNDMREVPRSGDEAKFQESYEHLCHLTKKLP